MRTSASRTKEQFDKLAEQIEDSWYIVVGQRVEGQTEDDKPQKDIPEKERKAMEIMSVTFIGGYMGREKGFPIPEVSDHSRQVDTCVQYDQRALEDMLAAHELKPVYRPVMKANG